MKTRVHHHAFAAGILRLQFQGSTVAPKDLATSAIVTTTPPSPSQGGATNVNITHVTCPALFNVYSQPAQSETANEVRLLQFISISTASHKCMCSARLRSSSKFSTFCLVDRALEIVLLEFRIH